MRLRPRRWFGPLPGLLVIGFLAASWSMPAVAAADEFDVHARLAVSGSTTFVGAADTEGDSAGIRYFAAEDDPVEMNIGAKGAHLKVVNAPYAAAGVRTAPPDGVGVTHALPTEVWQSTTFSGTVELLESETNASFRFMPLKEGETFGTRLRGLQEFTIAAPRPLGGPEPDGEFSGREPDINHSLTPPRTSATLSNVRPSNLSLSEDLFVMLFGGRVRVQDQDGHRQEVWSGTRLNESRTAADPSNTAGVWYYDRVLILLEGPDVTVELRKAQPRGLLTSIDRLQGTLDGDLSFAGVSGHVDVNGQNLTPEPVLFQTIGRFDATATYDGGMGTWAFEGPATFVGINGLTVVGDRLAHLQQSVWTVVGGVTLLGLLLAALTPAGRAFLGGILGRNEAQPLGHPVRQRFLRSIAAQPGITQSQLAAQAGIGLFTARHHLRVLRRAHLVDVVRQGAADAFLLNHSSFRFPAPPAPAREAGASNTQEDALPSAAKVMALLNHPIRNAIARALRLAGPSTYARMQETWKGLGLPPPLPGAKDVSYHATLLAKAGVLIRRRQGRSVQWRLAVDLDQLEREQERRSVGDLRAKFVHDLVVRRPGLARKEIVSEYAARHPSRPASTVDEVLLRLELLGRLARDPQTGTYTAL